MHTVLYEDILSEPFAAITLILFHSHTIAPIVQVQFAIDAFSKLYFFVDKFCYSILGKQAFAKLP